MPPNLPISRLIRVTINLAPLAAQAQDISTLLILGSSDVINVVERIRTYDTIDAVAIDFGTEAPEYLCALLWFEQAPQPAHVKIGRWAKTASAGLLNGGIVSEENQTLANWLGIDDGAFRITIDGVDYSLDDMDFGTADNLNGVAAIVQIALNDQSAGTTCVWNELGQNFVITSGTTGDDSEVSFGSFPPSATGNILFTENPGNNETITLNGTAVTFVAGGPVGNQVHIGADLDATLALLLTFLQASTNAQLVKFLYEIDDATLLLTAATPGAGGNALTIAASDATVSGGTLTGGSGTDISAMLTIRQEDEVEGCYEVPGLDAQTALETVVLFDSDFGQRWYAVTLPESDDADTLAVAPYIEASNNKHILGVSTQEGGVLIPSTTTDIASKLKALKYKKTVVQYSSHNANSVCSLLGRILTVDYNGNSTVITLMYKQEPGIEAESLTATQANSLATKNCNVFVAYNNDTAIIQEGKVASGDFLDTITGCDWLAITVMTALYNLLYTTNTKIPQTDAGTQLLVVTVEAVLAQAVTNGLLAPGVWNSNGFGTLKQGEYLPKGWYIYAPPVALQFQADREARKSVPIQVAAKLAGAVHTVDVAINVNR